MNILINELQKHLKETLAIDISLRPWKEEKKLPFFLINSYAFFEASILNNSCLLMCSKEPIELTPNTIKKHWEHVIKHCETPCIYTSNLISSYNRRRLIQLHIPFIIPNNQIYIPEFGCDLKEHFKQQRLHKELFSPAAQTVILSVLLREKRERLIPSELATDLGYSSMTMSRVFNELEAAGVGRLINKGRERWWTFEGTKKGLWEQTSTKLRSPIKSRESMKLWPGGKTSQMPLAGISALTEIASITPPSLPIYAMNIEEYKRVDIPKGFRISSDEADFELEIWNYDPKLFSENGLVDPFSLYLSLRETNDKRVEAALEELMEKIKW